MKASCYDDGNACPGGCDAHVVFHPSHNGTKTAFSPRSSRNAPETCSDGQVCMICFSDAESSCISVRFRGSGPPKGTFDFTPRFYSENCLRHDLPAPLARQCAILNRKVDVFKDRLNCFQEPRHPKCVALMESSRERMTHDAPFFKDCLSLGEAAFNRKYRDRPDLQRSLGCMYEAHGTGSNTRGVTWRKLLPAACREGSFVGPSGTDCCSANLYSVACFPEECGGFLPTK
jgi:hypothetical protein